MKLNYFALASVQEKEHVFKQYIYLLEGFYESTLSRYENGKGLQQDILKVQTEIASIKNKQLLLNSKSAHFLFNLRVLTHSKLDSVNAIFPIVQDALASLSNPFANEITSHRIQILLEEKERSVLQQNLVYKKSLPKLSFGIKYSLIDEKSGITENKDAYGFSLGISLPIWGGKYSDEEESYINESFSIDQKILNESKRIKESISYLKFDIEEKQIILNVWKILKNVY